MPPGENGHLLSILLDDAGHPRPEPRPLLLLVSPEQVRHQAELQHQNNSRDRVTIILHLKTPCLWPSAHAKSELLTLHMVEYYVLLINTQY